VLLNNFLRFNFGFCGCAAALVLQRFPILWPSLPMLKEGKSSTVATEDPAAGRWLGYALVGGGVLLLVERLFDTFYGPTV